MTHDDIATLRALAEVATPDRWYVAVTPPVLLGLLDERDELAAEVAAYQGRPEGGLPGWVYYAGWERNEPGVRLGVDQQGEDFSWGARPELCDSDAADRLMANGNAPSPRAAMRAAEAAARACGWLP